MNRFCFAFGCFQLVFGIINMFIQTNNHPGLTNDIGNILISGLVGAVSIPFFIWAFPVAQLKLETTNEVK